MSKVDLFLLILAASMLTKLNKGRKYRGLIELAHVTTAHESFSDATRREKQWQFEIHTPGRVFELRAESEGDMLMWLNEINEAVSSYHREQQVENCLCSEYECNWKSALYLCKHQHGSASTRSERSG